MQGAQPAAHIAVTGLACRRGDRVLFREVSFTLRAGEAIHVTGANGRGKSSLLRLIAGLARPFAGAVACTGAIGLVDERPALDPALPLGRALSFWSRIDGSGPDGLDVPGRDLLGLGGLLDIPVRYLSTGQRKRAAMARLLAQRAPIWLLDEPLNGLDTAAVALVATLVQAHCDAGGIAVIASHQAIDVAIAHRLAIEEFAPC